MPKNNAFESFRKDFEKMSADSSKIFKKVTKKGAIKFVNEAKKLTDNEKLVDTGNYRRNWSAETINEEDINTITCENNADYASHLEYGHKTRNGGRARGYFVGDRAVAEARFYCLEQLQKELEKLYKKPKSK